jgi:hypothetical protein
VSDIVKGLREAASGQGGLDYGDLWACCDEAADEIERLEAQLAEARRDAEALREALLNVARMARRARKRSETLNT